MHLSVLDQYPTSCLDHYRRDNRLPALGTSVVNIQVTIDPDGPGAAHSPATVLCKVTSNGQVCTEVRNTSFIFIYIMI